MRGARPLAVTIMRGCVTGAMRSQTMLQCSTVRLRRVSGRPASPSSPAPPAGASLAPHNALGVRGAAELHRSRAPSMEFLVDALDRSASIKNSIFKISIKNPSKFHIGDLHQERDRVMKS